MRHAYTVARCILRKVHLMTVFAVMSQSEEIGGQITAIYPEDSYKVGYGQWLVSDSSATARAVSEKLGLVKGSPYSSTLVVGISSYYGLHSTEMWDWIKAKLEASP